MKQVYLGILGLLLLGCCGIALAASAAQQGLPRATELHVIGVDAESDPQWRCAVWSRQLSGQSVVELALLEKTPKGWLVRQQILHLDAYAPEVRRVSDWQQDGHPVLVVSYQQGSSMQVELYGIAEQRLVLLESHPGEALGWTISPVGQTRLGLYARPEGQLQPVWWRWQDAKLQQVEP